MNVYEFPRSQHYVNPAVIKALVDYVKNETGEDWTEQLTKDADNESMYDINLKDYNDLQLGPEVTKQYHIVYPNGELYSEELYDDDTIKDALDTAMKEDYAKKHTNISDIASAISDVDKYL